MQQGADMSIILLAISNLLLLGSSRLGFSIRVISVQGAALGAFMLLVHSNAPSIHVYLLATLTMLLKGIVFPRLLMRTVLQVDVRNESSPFVGYGASILVGIAMLGAATWVSSRLPGNPMILSPMVLPVALWTIGCGLFLVVARTNAISQVLGYLVLENGIFSFGVGLVGNMPFLVEMGCLLDIFVAVFVMGIAIFHISQEFEHIDVDRLTVMKD